MNKKIVKVAKKGRKLTKKEIEELALQDQVIDVLAQANSETIALDTSSLPHYADASGVTGVAGAGLLGAEGGVAVVGTGLSTGAMLGIGALAIGGIALAAGGGGNDTPSDTIAPSITITDDETGVGSIVDGDITYTFTFNEAVTGFSADDIMVSNGEKGTFTTVSSTVYTLVITPTAGLKEISQWMSLPM